MKTFYASIFISREKMEEANIINPIKLEYYKIANRVEMHEEYGIEIVKTEYSKEDVKMEKKIINKLTRDEKEANKILELFKKNEVMPISAEDIIQEIVSWNNLYREKGLLFDGKAEIGELNILS